MGAINEHHAVEGFAYASLSASPPCLAPQPNPHLPCSSSTPRLAGHRLDVVTCSALCSSRALLRSLPWSVAVPAHCTIDNCTALGS